MNQTSPCCRPNRSSGTTCRCFRMARRGDVRCRRASRGRTVRWFVIEWRAAFDGSRRARHSRSGAGPGPENGQDRGHPETGREPFQCKGDILSARRTASVVRPRQIATYLSKLLTPLPAIGRRFGGRDHTTVLHAVRKITGLVAEDKGLANEIAILSGALLS